MALVLLTAAALAAGLTVGPAAARSSQSRSSQSRSSRGAPGRTAAASLAPAVRTASTSPRRAATTTPTAGTSPTTHAAAGPGGTYRVVGLGDSVPSGSNCGCTNYVTLVTRSMAAEAGKVALVHDEAEGGLTTSGVLSQLTQPRIRTEIADSDLVIVTVGANDFATGVLTSGACQPDPSTTCYAQTLADQRTQLASVLAQVRALQRGAHGGRTVVTGYWNVFLDGDVAAALGAQYVRDSTELTIAENTQIATLSSQAGAQYVDIYTPFKAVGNDTALLAPDGDHPSAAGHNLIATTLTTALR